MLKFNKATKVSLMLLGLFAFMFSGCNYFNNNPKKVDDDEDSDSSDDSSDNKSSETFKLGDRIEFGDYIVEINTFEDPYVETDEYLQPDAGNKCVAFEVEIENSTSGDSLSYSDYDFTLYDSDGYSYDSSWLCTKEPSLGTGEINAGKKVKGWVTFEVLEESEGFSVQYNPDWFSEENVEIELSD
ncbi:DUF4352 domain-containing protein [Candidatus Dojkabacteria bacterium]|nr:DUF4352 domain-containing protein [Candidatus Dojkabacteria bacterium]